MPSMAGASVLAGSLGLSFIVDYVDKATTPLKKTQDQVDATKKSIQGLGDAADASSKKVTNLAKAHQDLSGSLLKIGVVAGTTSYVLDGVARKMGSMFDGAIRNAAAFQTQLINTQLEIGNTSKTTYDSMAKLAVEMATTYNVSTLGASQVFYQLGGAFKNFAGIKALAPSVGQLSESSGGQLDLNSASALMTEYLLKMHPTEALRGGSTPQSAAALNGLGYQSLAVFNTLNQGSRMRFDQIDQFLRGIGPAAMALQGRGMNATSAETQLDALGMMTINRAGQTPDYAGQMAGWAANIYNPGTAAALSRYGVMTTGPGGRPRALQEVLYGNKDSFATSQMFQGYQNHTLGIKEQETAENLLGGQYMGQIFRILLGPGGKDDFTKNIAMLSEAISHPEKINALAKEMGQQRFEYQSSLFGHSIDALQTLATQNILPELAKGLRLVNGYLTELVLFLNNHPELVKLVTQVALLSTSAAGAALAFKGLSVGLIGLSTALNMGVRDLALFTGGWGLLGMAVAGVALAFTSNMGGLKDTVSWLESNFEKPFHNAHMVMQAFFQFLEHPGQIDSALLKNLNLNGMGVIVANMAQMSYNVQHLFTGLSYGFSMGLGPIINTVAGKGGIFSILFGDTGMDAQGGLEHFLKMLNTADFKTIGIDLGQGLANGINMLANAFKMIAPFAKEAFNALSTIFNFLKNSAPMTLGLIGQAVGGPIGNAIQGYGVYKELGSKDNAAQKGVAAGFYSTPFADVINGVTGAQQMQSDNWFTKAFGLMQAGPAGIRAAQALIANHPLGGNDMAIRANNVYVNGKPVSSGGDIIGDIVSGGKEGAGPLHGLNDLLHKLSTIAAVGTVSKLGMDMASRFMPELLEDKGFMNLRNLVGHASNLDPIGIAVKAIFSRFKLFGLGGAGAAAEGIGAGGAAAGGVGILGGGLLGLLGLGLAGSQMYMHSQTDKLAQPLSDLLLELFKKIFNAVGLKLGTNNFHLPGFGGGGDGGVFTPGKGPNSLMPSDPRFAAAAKKYGIPLSVLLGVARQETGLRNIVGDGGHGRGVMQIDDRWHADWLSKHHGGADIGANIDYGASLLAQNFATYHDWTMAENAYNAGIGGALSGGRTTTHTNGLTYAESVQAGTPGVMAEHDRELHVHVHMDGKEIAHHVKKLSAKDQAIKNGQAFALDRQNRIAIGAR